MALAAMDVARFEFGLTIPDDVSIVGYDNASLARWPAYNLTTIEQPADEMVAATVRGLLEQIEGKPPKSRHTVFDGDLIVGTSARIPKTGIQTKNGRTIWSPSKGSASFK
jgi:DNA-binding LacI/PurR family transcriptional regulator